MLSRLTFYTILTQFDLLYILESLILRLKCDMWILNKILPKNKINKKADMAGKMLRNDWV